MNKNKFITCALAAMMMASLAIPASAADTNIKDDTGVANNQTEVTLNYGDEDFDPTDPGAFTITVPARMDMTAEANGDDGVTFKDDNVISFSGMIGQNDKVVLNIKSEHNYHLMDGSTEVAGYTIDFAGTADNDGGIDIQTAQVGTGDGEKTISWNYAQAFNSESSIDMTFENDGANDIFGNGKYTDTLTYNYSYTSADDDNMIVCDEGYVINLDKEGNIIAPDLTSYINKSEDGHQNINFTIHGEGGTYHAWVDAVITNGIITTLNSDVNNNIDLSVPDRYNVMIHGGSKDINDSFTIEGDDTEELEYYEILLDQ